MVLMAATRLSDTSNYPTAAGRSRDKPRRQQPKTPSDPSAYQAPTTGILSRLPSSWVPYAEAMRLEQPHGVYMIYFPHIVGLLYANSALAAPVSGSIIAHRAAVFFVWTFLMRGAGCAWNDTVDQDLDRQTSRCRNRPVARGAISTTQALALAAGLTLAGFATIQVLPAECTFVAFGTLALTLLYPFGKRFTHFAQVILGSTLATTVSLSAYSVGLPALSAAYLIPTLCLTATIVLLVVFYDVVYARQDTADDLKSGVKGMAVRFRNHLEALFASLTILIVTLLTTLGVTVNMGYCYYLASVLGLALGLTSMVALTHSQQLSSWRGLSGRCYAFAIANLLGGFILESYMKPL